MSYNIRRKFFKNGKVQIAYYINNRCVGNLSLYDLTEPAYYIKYLNVQEKYQRRGIGTLLMQEATRDCKVCSLYVGINNNVALNFYKSLGFHISLTMFKKKHYLMTLIK